MCYGVCFYAFTKVGSSRGSSSRAFGCLFIVSGRGGVCFQQNLCPLRQMMVMETVTESEISIFIFRPQ